jgi:hypothetical protein
MATLVDELTARDLATLAAVVGSNPNDLASELRSRPWRIHDLLADGSVFDAVVDRHTHPARLVSPVLLFAVLIHRAADELRDAPYVNDWAGPRARLPVFDVAPLNEYLDDFGRMAFLAKLLASFAVPEPLPFPEENTFDLVALSRWLDSVPDRQGLMRRMGDLALFLSGVFPDRTGSCPLPAVDAERMGRGVGMTSDEILALCDPVGLAPGLTAFETLGARWYQSSRATQPPVVGDVAHRFSAARRVLTHIADTQLYRLETGFPLAS